MKKAFLFPLLWLVVITTLSIIPPLSLPKFDLFATDKLGHAGFYFILAFLLMRAFAAADNRVAATTNERLGAFAFAATYGAFMEWVQGTYFPNRSFEYDDMIANTFGAAMALVVYYFLAKRKN
jgi:VanZ family protein